ncbi:hypothetical protein HZA39_02490 [Candidatus Peregrinibacteria bacterium]|nr:hypothetical protein [Candidatus Peregrinibacteria bacterium]
MSKRSISKIIIAGPCAAESQEQIESTADKISALGNIIMRASIFKPRTRPGFEGLGEKGIKLLIKAAEKGIAVATEVMLPEHVNMILEKIADLPEKPELILWIGSRNQCHISQREIAKIIHEKAPKSTKLMIKNQPWKDEAHWIGIVEHVLSSGLAPERIILCHRGFCPDSNPNPNMFRNLPDYTMAMRIKAATKLPMIIDPSHIGGSIKNVFCIIEEANKFNFDGMMVEVHPDPKNAETDAKQQLNFDEFEDLLAIINS